MGSDYARAEEGLGPDVRIIRLPFGPRRYIRKELLWDHLDQLVDRYLAFARKLPRLPDLIHSHYADAGHVAQRLSSLLGIPFVHTGHSLGRVQAGPAAGDGGQGGGPGAGVPLRPPDPGGGGDLAPRGPGGGQHPPGDPGAVRPLHPFQPPAGGGDPPGHRRFPVRAPRAPQGGSGRRRQGGPVPGPRPPAPDPVHRPPGAVQEPPGPGAGLRRPIRNCAPGPTWCCWPGSHEDIQDLDEEGRATWEELLRTLDRLDLFGSVAFPKSHPRVGSARVLPAGGAAPGHLREPGLRRELRPHPHRGGRLGAAGGHHRQRRTPGHRRQLPQRTGGGAQRRPGPGRGHEGGPGGPGALDRLEPQRAAGRAQLLHLGRPRASAT